MENWGLNTNGQFGLGDTVSPRTSPVQLGTDVTWTDLMLTTWHTCATRSDGTLWCWGRNTDGQLGRGDTISPATSPVQLAGTTWRSLTGGDAFTCAVQTGNTLWCWGRNGQGQLGRGDTVTPATSPVQVGTDTTWRSVAGGSSHVCATRSDNTLWCWGSNFDGQVGRGNTVGPATSPAQVTGTPGRSVTAGSYHNCALKTVPEILQVGTDPGRRPDQRHVPGRPPQTVANS